MSSSVATKLEAARARLEELGRLTSDLATSHAGVFEEPELRTYLDTFRRAHDEAQARLANPTLSIATIGTTSSGKSTIVNALVGRRIAPIEAGEMSGGVLTLRSGSERRLTVEAADGAPWEAGTWTGISDADAYGRVRDGVMRPYHEARKSRACLAPQVLSEGPLLPSIDSSLLGLPSDLGVEFIDLPGLKSVQDRANLAVIQTRVHKAFSLVALDYLQTDEEHRKKLLEELTRVVKYLQGRPDSMIFVLNRVDQRGMDDEPVETRVAALRREIKDVLGLQSEPDVLPFESRLLYRAQCAWGAADATRPDTTPEQRLEHLRALFEESASSLKKRGREQPELRSWLREIEDLVEEGRVPADDDLRALLERAREWSGGKELWQRLRARIEESFAELVILPALIEVLDTHRSFTDALGAVSKIRKIDSQEQLERERQRLQQLQFRLHEEVSATRERFRNRLTAAAEGLKTGDQAVRHRLTKDLGPGFESLLGAINEVTGDLTRSLIAPMRDALKASRGVYDLEEELCRVLDPALAKDLTRAYDLFSRRIPTLSRGKGTLTLRVRDNDGPGVERLRETERDARRLYQSMRECLVGRAEFKLQGQAESIRGALTGLLEQQADAIKTACLMELPDLSLDQAIESARRARSRSELLDLPEQFFTLPTAVDRRRHEQLEVVGKRQVVEHDPEGICCFKEKKTRTVTRNVTEIVAYQDLALPDEDGMARQWSDGVKGGEDSLWETLRDWMVEALLESSGSFSAAIESVLRLADRALEQQQRLAADEHEAVVELWKRIDWEVDRLVGSRDRLFRAAKSEHE
jgi:energy-coupling factor transporter ATP-binding protein EcfA2